MLSEDPLYSFLDIGGFIYFNTLGHIVAVNAIKSIGYEHYESVRKGSTRSVSMLQFESPARLPPSAVEDLGERLQPVTLDMLRANGAARFAWIKPGELLRGMTSPTGGRGEMVDAVVFP